MEMSNESESFVICINNDGFPASLEVRKVYRVLPDPTAAAHHCLRILDESGEDYIYPEDLFIPIELPQAAKEALAV